MSTTRVPFLDLARLHAELRTEIDDAVRRVVDRGMFVLGEEVERFEQAWAVRAGARHAVGVGNGLDALTLALRAAGVGPGHEVVVPSYTFVATWLSVRHVGAVPVPVDVASPRADWRIDAVEASLTPRTRAIVPVHLTGHPVDLGPVLELAQAHGLAVVDDAAQAHGAAWDGRAVGSVGHATAWSFYPGKNLGALGDGGAVTTSDDAVAERLRRLRNYGSTVKHRHDEIGWNSRLDELQAAVLNAKLSHLDDHQRRRADVARRYGAALDGLDAVTLPGAAPEATPAWHLYVVQTPHRDDLRTHLARAGVETGIHYPVPPHRHPAFTGLAAHHRLPVAEQLSDQVLSLPMGPTLDPAAQDVVIDAVRSFTP